MMPNYRPANSFESPRFSGVRTFLRLPHIQDLDGVDFAIVGVPFDTGASFKVGARFGPEAVRGASVLLRPNNVVLQVPVFDILSGIDYGDAPVVPGFTEDSYARIEAALAPVQEAGVVPICIGGDHSIALPELRAAAKHHGPLPLVLFDSHPDTWDSYFGHRYFHGTPFKRAVEEGLIDTGHSVMCGLRGPGNDLDDWQVARDLGFDVITASEMHMEGIASLPRRILERVDGRPAFLSFDIDFLDPAFAPGTGTPEVGGFSTWQAQHILRGLTGLNIVAADVVEVLPAYDHGQITAHAAANVAFEIVTLLAWHRRQTESHP
jgi:agmatinase